ncbi:uncharacterized protein CLUP02_11685 [Colletotrichum lupini]|uniref:Uncharacterized protein n=1 Tax=Colletotrichum lupini TaxID=145971 RepID=A0A9Q8SZV7_9PEZI|nr:uncharacterized protein CLUP02_11685 [Colletotrichum lupini]UQC86185.1 hypothetical protein CLUP02_11685 [Colletotrichum lupini]
MGWVEREARVKRRSGWKGGKRRKKQAIVDIPPFTFASIFYRAFDPPNMGVPSHVRTNGIEDKTGKQFPPKSKRHQLQLPEMFDRMTLARHLHFFDHKTTIIQVLL